MDSSVLNRFGAGCDMSIAQSSERKIMATNRTAFTRADWLKAAKTILIDSGIDDVKVDVMARKMKITRGSFYWHFKSRHDLHDEILADWIARNRAGIEQLRKNSESGVPSFTDCIRFWISQEDDVLTFDMAMRVWGRKSSDVALAIYEIDNRWIDLLTDMFIARGVDKKMAFARARIVYFHQMGYYTLDLRETLEERVEMIPLYSEILLGDTIDAELEPLMQDLLARAKSKKASSKRQTARKSPKES